MAHSLQTDESGQCGKAEGIGSCHQRRIQKTRTNKIAGSGERNTESRTCGRYGILRTSDSECSGQQLGRMKVLPPFKRGGFGQKPRALPSVLIFNGEHGS